jgi:hypothetical protein
LLDACGTTFKMLLLNEQQTLQTERISTVSYVLIGLGVHAV